MVALLSELAHLLGFTDFAGVHYYVQTSVRVVSRPFYLESETVLVRNIHYLYLAAEPIRHSHTCKL